MPHQPRRARAVAAGATAALLALTACSGSGTAANGGSGGSGSTSTGGSASATSAAPAPVPAGLERYYAQRPSWSGCGGGFQCATVEVPVDYRRPAGKTVRLSVVRLPAARRGDRIGSLVLNPGGPGASGVGYARRAANVLSDAVRRRYDVVGFDPRGVGQSDPLQCLDDAETDALIGSDPTPDDAAEVRAVADEYKDVAADCKANGGTLLAHVSTAEAARDMDVLRAVLGDRRLNFLGKSYGTFLGATYAHEFPANVGRFVLDGALDPALDADAINLGQAEGFEVATRAFVSDCLRQSPCPLGSDVDAGVERLQRLMRDLDARPLTTQDPARPLTEGRGALGVASALYDDRFWPVLRQGLQSAFAGDGSTLLALADALTDRGPDGFQSNANTVIYAVNCLDRPAAGGLAAVQQSVPRFARAAPTWGPFLAWSELACVSWPVKSAGRPEPVRAEGSGPIVVVGTTRDPATPYAWAQGLSHELANGHLITYDGDGHTAYRRGSRCVDDAVDAYLLRGQVPKEGLRCD